MGVLFIKTVIDKRGVFDRITVGEKYYFICDAEKVFLVFSTDRNSENADVRMFIEHGCTTGSARTRMLVISNIIYGYQVGSNHSIFTRHDEAVIKQLQKYCMKTFSDGIGRVVVPARIHVYEDWTVRIQYLGNPAVILFKDNDGFFKLLSLQDGALYTTNAGEEIQAFEAAMNFINGEWCGNEIVDSELSAVMKETYWEPVLRVKFLGGCA